MTHFTKFKLKDLIPSKKDKWVLITGGSGGIGSSFAFELANIGFNLFLTSTKNSSFELQFLKDQIKKKFKVDVKILTADLAKTNELNKLISAIKKLPSLSMIINNAGFGVHGFFEQEEFSKIEEMILVHAVASIKIIKELLPKLRKERKAFIINVASLAGFMPMIKSSIYSASKSFLIRFSESLNNELVSEGIKVQALCPGFVKTNFFKHNSSKNKPIFKSKFIRWQKPEFVVRYSLKSLGKKFKVVVIPGCYYRIFFFVFKLIPKHCLYRFLIWLDKK